MDKTAKVAEEGEEDARKVCEEVTPLCGVVREEVVGHLFDDADKKGCPHPPPDGGGHSEGVEDGADGYRQSEGGEAVKKMVYAYFHY